MFYDSMIAKLITYGNNRDEAIEKMKEYLIDAYWYRIPAKSNVEKTLKALKKSWKINCGFSR